MKQFVVDASVAVKWFIPEIGADEAKAYHPGVVRVLAPDVFIPEVANSIRGKVRREELTAREARDLIGALGSLPVEILPTRPLIPRAMDIALTGDMAIYDSLYIALAERLGCPLITADGPMLRAGRIAANTVDIRSLLPA